MCITGWSLLIGYLILDLASLIPVDSRQNNINFALSKELIFARWQDISIYEIRIRLISSIIF